MSDDVRKLIAVIDENEQVLDAVGLVLRLHGLGVVLFQNGQNFLAALDGIRPDVLLLDPHLSDIHSHEILNKISLDPRLDDVRVVAITAYPNADEVRKLRDSRVEQILLKPITEQVLLNAL